jgi:hypothetical protein
MSDRPAVDLAEAVNGDDVRVVDPGGGLIRGERCWKIASSAMWCGRTLSATTRSVLVS